MKRIEGIIIILFVLLLTACSKKEYVYFNYGCGNTEYYKCELKNNKLNCNVKNPTCEGKEFLGWYEANNYDDQVDLYENFIKNTVIYARWKDDNGKIIPGYEETSNINDEGSSIIEDMSNISEEPSLTIEQPSIIGDKKTYILTFMYNNGTNNSPVNVSVQNGQALPNVGSVPIRVGYKFMGWYDNAKYELGTQYYDSSNKAVRKYDKNSNMTLYAGWKANTLSIEYNGNYGEWNISSSTYTTNVDGTVILKSTRQIYKQQISYEKSLPSGGLIDANGKEFNWKKENYKIESGKEYIIQNGTKIVELNQNTQYTAKELANYVGCNLLNNDCTITVKVNWKDDITVFVDRITHKSAFVTVYARSTKPIAGYYFATRRIKPKGDEKTWVLTNSTKLEIAKMPGTYYVYVKDNSGKISEPETLTITYDELYKDGPKSYDKTALLLTTNLSNFLLTRGDSIDNLNNFIAQSVKSAGLFTKEGVVTAGISAANYLLIKHGVNIPYSSNIDCFIQRYNVNFGANPNWGARTGCEKYPYGGLDCQSFIGWSIHNGGFKAENTGGSYGDTKRIKYCRNIVTESNGTQVCNDMYGLSDVSQRLYARAEIGDQISSDLHWRLIIGKFEGGVYVYEGTTPVGMGKYTYEQLYNSKYYILIKMQGYYDGDNHACLKDSKNNTISLPAAYSDRASEFRTNCSTSN